jgi:exo-beta-1,3-glucanase (GH17 family)
MKKLISAKPVTLPRIIVALLLTATLCGAVEPVPAGGTALPIQQKKSDLLSGQEKGLCYSGFRHGQHPDRGAGAVNPSDAEILEDLQILSRQCQCRLIRLYDAQENSEAVLRVIQANKIGMKVLLGAWLEAEVSNPNCPWHKEPYPATTLEANKLKNAKEIGNAIRLANAYPGIVVAVAVGNEALVTWNDHMVPVEAVIDYVRRVKNGIHQPVTVADNYDWWTHHGSALAKELDFVSVHTYPIWEGKDIGEAMSLSIANIQAVRDALPHSRLVITEAGWATVASEFGARAGEEKQKRYYQDLYAWAGKMNITTFFFEAFDEDWKGQDNNPRAAEKHWGLFTVERRPKLAALGPR